MATEDATTRYAIHAACRDGQTQKVESLLNVDPKLALRRDEDGRLPLHWAAIHNHLPIIQHLSTLPSFDPDAQDELGWTALMMASSISDAEPLVTHLLSRAADPNITTSTGQVALHFAASKSHLDVARALLAAEASARVKDKRGQLPLHRAAAVGCTPIVRLLLASKSPVSATDVDGCTALHHAVAEGHGDAAVELLKAGIDASKRDSSGALAIDLAPDAKVRGFVMRAAEEEGLDLVTK